jgi:hypothetical protein
MTSREVFINNSHQFVIQCRDLLLKERDMLQSMDNGRDLIEVGEEEHANQAAAVKISAMSMLGAMSSLREELSYTKQEVAFGVSTYDDLENLLHRLEGLMIPLLGLSKIPGLSIMSRRTSQRSTPLTKLINAMMLSAGNTIEELDHGLQHTELLKRANGLFSQHVTIPAGLSRDENVGEEKPRTAMELARNDIASKLLDQDDDDSSNEDYKALDPDFLAETEEHLYMSCLLQSSSAAAQELSEFVRSQLVKDTVRKRRLILPRVADIPFFASIASRSQEHPFHVLDPEHLPPRNIVEKFGNMLRAALSTLGSDSSKFGFRIVAATMSIGIIAFLKSTQHFFVEYRLVWAMVMVPIFMSPTAGTAIYGFIGRALGVAAAMLLEYVNWYITDGKTGGVVVFFFASMMVYYFLLLKYPRLLFCYSWPLRIMS